MGYRDLTLVETCYSVDGQRPYIGRNMSLCIKIRVRDLILVEMCHSGGTERPYIGRDVSLCIKGMYWILLFEDYVSPI